MQTLSVSSKCDVLLVLHTYSTIYVDVLIKGFLTELTARVILRYESTAQKLQALACISIVTPWYHLAFHTEKYHLKVLLDDFVWMALLYKVPSIRIYKKRTVHWKVDFKMCLTSSCPFFNFPNLEPDYSPSLLKGEVFKLTISHIKSVFIRIIAISYVDDLQTH